MPRAIRPSASDRVPKSRSFRMKYATVASSHILPPESERLLPMMTKDLKCPLNRSRHPFLSKVKSQYTFALELEKTVRISCFFTPCGGSTLVVYHFPD